MLDRVDVEIAPGEVHALLGANGAGKSTLAKILAGVVTPDRAELRLSAAPFAPSNRRQARAAGVEIVLQELSIFDTLSVAENLFLDEVPRTRWGWVDRTKLHREAQSALGRVGLPVDPRTPAGQLGVAEKQLVEIAAALRRDCRLLILDEPTATLPADAAERLFEQLRRLRAEGVSILLITHRLEDVHAVADRVTVLRDGCVAASGLGALEGIEVLESALGLGGASERRGAPDRQGSEALLRICGLSGAGFSDVDLEVARGEILGLGGLVGSGRTELLRAIYGVDARTEGSVYLGSRKLPCDVGASVSAGLGFVPEERQSQGLFLELSIEQNLSVSSPTLARGWRSRLGWVDFPRTRDRCVQGASDVELVYRDLAQKARELSGGNQQKVVLARWLLAEAEVLLLDEPSRGVDLGARRSVHQLLRQRADSGGALLVVSSDFDELLGLCDTIGVLAEGRLTDLRPTSEWSHSSLLAAALGRAA